MEHSVKVQRTKLNWGNTGLGRSACYSINIGDRLPLLLESLDPWITTIGFKAVWCLSFSSLSSDLFYDFGNEKGEDKKANRKEYLK